MSQVVQDNKNLRFFHPNVLFCLNAETITTVSVVANSNLLAVVVVVVVVVVLYEHCRNLSTTDCQSSHLPRLSPSAVGT